MKRPRIFCVVAAWCCIAMLMQASYLTRPAKAYQAAGEPVPQLWNWLPLVALGFVLWQTIGLVRLLPFHRWFAVAFFVWWTLVLGWNCAVTLHRASMTPVSAILLVSVLATLNLPSAWYLSRPKFREFSVRFVAERDEAKHSAMMQKVSRKQILDDTRS